MTDDARSDGLTRSGLGVVGDLHWGTHFCHFYETKEDLLDTVVPYFKAGLEQGEFCLWVVSEPLTPEEARQALQREIPGLHKDLAERRIEVLSHRDWYLKNERFELRKVIAAWNEKLNEGLGRGFPGMRASGDTGWLHDENWRDFREYECELSVLLSGKRMLVLCTYPLSSVPAARILDVAKIHSVAVARRKGHIEIVETPELKVAKETIQRLKEGLEQRVAERTLELTVAKAALENELIQRRGAEKQLQDSHQRLEVLAGRLESLREEERTRISREIHDELGQKLTGLKMDLLWVERKLGETTNAAAISPILERVVEATELVDTIMTTVQRIGTELRPGVLDKLGLGVALQFEGRRFQERTGIRCDVRLPESVMELSPGHATALYRIFQECLTNVARHARATHVTAELKVEGDFTVLSVKDNGRGITEEEVDGPHSLGLLGMKERAAFLGGAVHVQRLHEGGTQVAVRLPQTPKEAAG